MYLNGDVVNENGTVSIANPVGSINVTGEVRGASVTINAGRDFNLNTEDWLHTNRDPRQYINFHPMRQMVFNTPGNTVRRAFATASSVVIPTYRTIRFWGFTFTVPDYNSPAANLQTEINKDQSQILAQGAINVTAQYLNVDGLIQSGSQTLKLDVSPSFRMTRSTTSLTDAKNLPLPVSVSAHRTMASPMYRSAVTLTLLNKRLSSMTSTHLVAASHWLESCCRLATVVSWLLTVMQTSISIIAVLIS